MGDRLKGNRCIPATNGNKVNGLPEALLESLPGYVDVLSTEYYAPWDVMAYHSRRL